jgi:hypothetical protein
MCHITTVGCVAGVARPDRVAILRSVKAYVGVADGDWYRFLAERPELTEVNFRRPSSAREFRAITVGEPFFFRAIFHITTS